MLVKCWIFTSELNLYWYCYLSFTVFLHTVNHSSAPVDGRHLAMTNTDLLIINTVKAIFLTLGLLGIHIFIGLMYGAESEHIAPGHLSTLINCIVEDLVTWTAETRGY